MINKSTIRELRIDISKTQNHYEVIRILDNHLAKLEEMADEKKLTRTLDMRRFKMEKEHYRFLKNLQKALHKI